MRYILASQSRDRKKIFERAGIPIEIQPSNFDENSINHPDPLELVKILAQKKAEEIIDQISNTNENIIIFGADSMVLFNDELIGKPKNRENAFEILSKLSGQAHQLITGVYVFHIPTNHAISFSDSTKIWFQKISSEEINTYLDSTTEYDGRAGAYSLYEKASLFISKIEGSPTNVLGFPLSKTRELMAQDMEINLLS